jgi:hypothetical protein
MSKGGVPQETLELVHLRASQINGCSACVDAGARAARRQVRPTSGSGPSQPGGSRRTSAMPNGPRWRSPRPPLGSVTGPTRFRIRSGPTRPTTTTSRASPLSSRSRPARPGARRSTGRPAATAVPTVGSVFGGRRGRGDKGVYPRHSVHWSFPLSKDLQRAWKNQRRPGMRVWVGFSSRIPRCGHRLGPDREQAPDLPGRLR